MERPYSVIYGRDKDVIPVLLQIHACENPSILDCTYNKGRMWKGIPYKPTRMDICPDYELDFIADFKNMPFQDESYDVIVFDPPHRTVDAGNHSAYSKYNEGITDELRMKDNISSIFPPFLTEAKRVLKKNGIILAKLADMVHDHRTCWHHVDFINDVKKIGLCACDMMIKIDPSAGNLGSSKWKNVKHLRKKHCYWIVCRKGKCER